MSILEEKTNFTIFFPFSQKIYFQNSYRNRKPRIDKRPLFPRSKSDESKRFSRFLNEISSRQKFRDINVPISRMKRKETSADFHTKTCYLKVRNGTK